MLGCLLFGNFWFLVFVTMSSCLVVIVTLIWLLANDELMAPQNIAANVIVNNGKDSIILDSNSPTNPLLVKIGELCFDVKHDEEEKFLAAVSSVQPHMLIFKEINLCKQEKKFLQIGSMQVEIKHAETPG